MTPANLDLRPLFPAIVVALTGIAVLLAQAFTPKGGRAPAAALSLAGLAGALVTVLVIAGGRGRGAVLAHSVAQRRERRLLRPISFGDAIEHCVVVVELRKALCRFRVALVGDIVCGAGEMIDRDDGRPQRGRREPRRDGKVFVMSDRHGSVHLAELVY